MPAILVSNATVEAILGSQTCFQKEAKRSLRPRQDTKIARLRELRLAFAQLRPLARLGARRMIELGMSLR